MTVKLVAAMMALLPVVHLLAPPPLAPVTIARGVFDFDGDGRDDELLLLFVGGRRGPDPEPWCGGYNKYTGQFVLEARLASGRTVRTSLNELFHDERGELFFGAREQPFTIEFADYNNDGQPDLFVFQYAACMAFDYRFFTVAKSGEVAELPIGPKHDTIFLRGAALEADFRPTDSGFAYHYYDSTRNVSVEGCCVWFPGLQRFDCDENEVDGDDEDQSDDGPGCRLTSACSGRPDASLQGTAEARR